MILCVAIKLESSLICLWEWAWIVKRLDLLLSMKWACVEVLVRLKSLFLQLLFLKFNLSCPKYYLVSNIWRLNVPNTSSSKDRIFSSAISQNPFEPSPQRRPGAPLVTNGLIFYPRILWLFESDQYANRAYSLPKLRVNVQCQRSVLIICRFGLCTPKCSALGHLTLLICRGRLRNVINLKRTCTAIALLIKYSVLCRTRCRCHRGLLVPFVSTWRRTSSLGCYHSLLSILFVRYDN